LPVIILVFGQMVLAQTVPTTQLLPDTAKMTYNQISQQMKLYVYPAKGQSKQQQKALQLVQPLGLLQVMQGKVQQ
jgi:hypothetical protein